MTTNSLAIQIVDYLQPATRYVQVTVPSSVAEDTFGAKQAVLDAMRQYIRESNLKIMGPVLVDEVTLWQNNEVILKVAVEESDDNPRQ